MEVVLSISSVLVDYSSKDFFFSSFYCFAAIKNLVKASQNLASLLKQNFYSLMELLVFYRWLC